MTLDTPATDALREAASADIYLYIYISIEREREREREGEREREREIIFAQRCAAHCSNYILMTLDTPATDALREAARADI